MRCNRSALLQSTATVNDRANGLLIGARLAYGAV